MTHRTLDLSLDYANRARSPSMSAISICRDTSRHIRCARADGHPQARLRGPRGGVLETQRTRNGTGEGETMADEVQGLTVGSTASFTAMVSQDSIDTFGNVTGDKNPLHSDAAYAARTRFKQPIAHGMIGAAFISAAMATRLAPGYVIVYLGQNLEFVAPVYEYDVLTVTCTVTAVEPRRNRVKVDTIVTNQDSAEVIRGEAYFLVDELAPEAAE